jgi:methionyl aminopeptidase
MDKNEYESYLKAGKIAKEAVDYAKNLIKPGMPLLEITEKIESKIFDLGGELAFPVNLSIDEVAAHYHPTLEDDKKAQGLLKVDI